MQTESIRETLQRIYWRTPRMPAPIVVRKLGGRRAAIWDRRALEAKRSWDLARLMFPSRAEFSLAT